MCKVAHDRAIAAKCDGIRPVRSGGFITFQNQAEQMRGEVLKAFRSFDRQSLDPYLEDAGRSMDIHHIADLLPHQG